MQKMSFGRFDSITSVTLGYALAMMLIGAAAALSYRSTYQLIDAGRWVSHTGEVRAALEAVMAAIAETETSQRGFVITGKGLYLEKFDDARLDSYHHLEELRQLTSDNSRQ